MTSLHPWMVHTPIALLLIWPLLDACGLILRSTETEKVAVWTLLCACLSSLPATVTGQAAYDAEIRLGNDPQTLNAHADLATWIPWWAIALAAGRLVSVRKKLRWLRVLVLAGGVVLAIGVLSVARTGTTLVYHHSVGIHGPTQGASK